MYALADSVMDTVRALQKHATCAQALDTAANGQWSKDLGNILETFAANLRDLGTGSTWRSELLAEIQSCFEVRQVHAQGYLTCMSTNYECLHATGSKIH